MNLEISIKTFISIFIFCNFFNEAVICQVDSIKLNKIIDFSSSLFSEDDPGAVILVAKNGIPIFEEGYGLADLEKSIPLAPNHTFAIGSLTKQFTATTVLILAEEGKLSIDDNIIQYFPSATNFRNIKIYHLLTHSSGIPDFFSIENWRNDLSIDLSLQETFDLIIQEDLEFEPGEKTKYSNSGYYLLGMICEKVSGKSLNDLITTNILEPLSMTQTCFIDGRNPHIPSAHGYELVSGKIVEPFLVSKTRFYAGGSIITTVTDLLKWDEALYSENILNESSLKTLFDPVILIGGEKTDFACGWTITNYGGTIIYGHGGGINGYVCQVYRLPSEHIYVAVLSNIINRTTKNPIASIAQQIISILLEGNDHKTLITSILLSKDEAQKYGGKYQLQDGSIRRILVQDSKVYYEVNESQKVEIIPESKIKFRAGKASTIKFLFSETEEVLQFELYTGRGKPIIGIKL